MKIFAFIQHENGKINRASFESLRGAQLMAELFEEKPTAVLFTNGVTDQLTGYDLAEIITIEHSNLETYNTLAYVSALEQLINAESPDVFVFAHTYEARDWIPRLSARLDVPFVADAIGFNNETGLLFVRQIYQGKINSDVSTECAPTLVSFQPGSFRLDEISGGSATPRSFSADLDNIPNMIRHGEKFQESVGTVDLSRAELIVSVGRGIGKEENIPLIKELASSLQAELAASRPVVDYGWLPHEIQVGSSGQTVSPKLYLAVGISGAVQHQVGMRASDNIVAINKDPNAPIFEIADYGIVADLFDIVPKLTEEVKNHS